MRRLLQVLPLIFLAACGRSGLMEENYPAGLRIEPNPLKLYAGQKVKIRVTALYEEFTTEGWRMRAEDVSGRKELALWTSSHLLAEVQTGPELWAHKAGRTDLQAYFLGAHARIPVEISPFPLYRIELSPPELELALGKYQQLTLTGRLTDESEIELSSPLFGTVYESSDPLVATVTSEGLVFAQSDGRTQVTARLGEFLAQTEVIAGSGRSLYAVDLVPARVELDVGESARLQLIGRFTDQSVEDLTNHALTRFETGNSEIIKVEPGGLVVALAPGESFVLAYHRNFQSTTTVVVHRPQELVDLVVTPAWMRLESGDRVQLQVQAVYLGGTFQDVTGKSDFVALDPDVAEVTPTELVTSSGQGTTPVHIRYASRTAVCQVAVDQPAEWLEAKPEAALLQPGGQLFVQVFKHDEQGGQSEVTTQASFVSLAPQVAEVDATGRVKALSPGAASLLVSWRGLETAVQITVSGD